VLGFTGSDAAHAVVDIHTKPAMEEALRSTLIEAITEIVTEGGGLDISVLQLSADSIKVQSTQMQGG
jgi:hypothetical protein